MTTAAAPIPNRDLIFTIANRYKKNHLVTTSLLDLFDVTHYLAQLLGTPVTIPSQESHHVFPKSSSRK